jgi:hypothetical protein
LTFFGRCKVDESGTDSELGGLELALVSAALQVSERKHIETSLARPVNAQSVEEACTVIAELGSPPLQVSVARDLASAGFTTEQLRPLLASTLEAGIEATTEALDARREELARRGPTVSGSDFPERPTATAG